MKLKIQGIVGINYLINYYYYNQKVYLLTELWEVAYIGDDNFFTIYAIPSLIQDYLLLPLQEEDDADTKHSIAPPRLCSLLNYAWFICLILFW